MNATKSNWRWLPLLNFVVGAAVFAQDPFADDPRPAPAAPAAPPVIAPAPANPNALPEPARRTARGIRMRVDGSVYGEVNYIDESTLTLHPVANAVVTFIQNRVVVAQQRTNSLGQFEVKGLTPSAIYSVFVTNSQWFSATAAVALPAPVAAVQGNNNAAAAQPVNRFNLLVANQNGERVPAKLTAAKRALFQDADVLEIQLVPREDFITALRSGALGNDVGGFGPGGFGGPGGMGPGGAGGGVAGGGGSGGGGGGGGGAGGGIGGALGAAGIAGGIAAGSSRRARFQPATGDQP